MKPTKLNNKLSLGKKTIAKLDEASLASVQGGGSGFGCNIKIVVIIKPSGPINI